MEKFTKEIKVDNGTYKYVDLKNVTNSQVFGKVSFRLIDKYGKICVIITMPIIGLNILLVLRGS